MTHRLPSVSAAPRRSIRRSALSLAGLVAIGLTTAAAAQAATTAEVVTRGDGAAGPTIGVVNGTPGAVSNDGRWAAFSLDPTAARYTFGTDDPVPALDLFVRDVAGNRLFQITHGVTAKAAGFDNAGRRLLYDVVDQTMPSFSDSATLFTLDMTNGASEIVGRATGKDGAVAAQANGLLSGDGASVVFTSSNVPGSGPGIYRRTLATNVTTRLGDLPPWRAPIDDPQAYNGIPGIESISDDGKVFSVDTQVDPEVDSTVIFTPTGHTEVPGRAIVSGDGSTAAYLRGNGFTEAQLVIRTVASGQETVVDGPPRINGDAYEGTVVGLTGNGSQVVVAPYRPFIPIFSGPAAFKTSLYDRATRAWGSAGPFGDALRGSRSNEPIPVFDEAALSRNLRYSLFTTLDPTTNYDPVQAIAIGDNYGGALPGGGTDHPPASVYATPTWYSACGTSSAGFRITLSPPFLDAAKSLRAAVWVDGTYVGERTYTAAAEEAIPVPAGAKTLTVASIATFADGTTSTGTWNYSVENHCG
ncbi:MAG: hypothetical protein AAGC46_10435 [Solirubrobacteraceae bacterium]|nr:hypothetical protein [Patulibacter sp.]